MGTALLWKATLPAPASYKHCHQCLELCLCWRLLLKVVLHLSCQLTAAHSPQAIIYALWGEPAGVCGNIQGEDAHGVAQDLGVLLEKLQGNSNLLS